MALVQQGAGFYLSPYAPGDSVSSMAAGTTFCPIVTKTPAARFVVNMFFDYEI